MITLSIGNGKRSYLGTFKTTLRGLEPKTPTSRPPTTRFTLLPTILIQPHWSGYVLLYLLLLYQNPESEGLKKVKMPVSLQDIVRIPFVVTIVSSRSIRTSVNLYPQLTSYFPKEFEVVTSFLSSEGHR